MKFKSFILLAGLTGLIVAAGYWLGGRDGVVIAVIFSAVMNFGTYWFSDKIVLAMYRAKPLSEKESPLSHRIVARIAEKMGIPKPRIYIVNLPVPNAFATGRDKNHAVVAVTPAILQLLNEKELEGVLAHELGHIQNRDILISSVAATLAGAISYLAQFAYFAMIFGGGRGRDGNGGNPFGALAMLILTPIIATLLHLAISRSREYLADETGAKILGDSDGLASALQKLHSASRTRPLIGQPKHEATAHMFIVNPFKSSLLTQLFSTHPPMEERVKRLRGLTPHLSETHGSSPRRRR
ncbi:MAG: zinc metalloprotease HtpX [Candidatus Harrisonbacteria bacterium]|nr:zinc metalloprotease HtpX [Candidatus Harrisonbacteria bacterium]